MKKLILFLSVAVLVISGSSAVLAMEKQSYLPLEVGTEWIYENNDEVETVRVEEFTEIAKEKAYRLEWYVKKKGTAGRGYNIRTEYWGNTKKGVKLLGRRSHGFEKVFAKPFFIIKYPVKKNDKWEGEINLGHRKAVFKYTHEGAEKIITGVGRLTATRVRHSVFNNVIDTWYSQGIGIVKISNYQKTDGKLVEKNTRNIQSYKIVTR